MTCSNCFSHNENSLAIAPHFPDCVPEEQLMFDLGLLYFHTEGVSRVNIIIERVDENGNVVFLFRQVCNTLIDIN